ncbi:hypothetical protein [Halobacillus mangrovi]|uniref:Uncharacterized protein n=1 Tax=Halobacillus mangrovi TaxID=402384 RepID=A0A1W5ZZU0_9BACI|nr:hypothetical protein [Halobacillus mangrovi]ARI78885.1 hypothetical protein HM131_19555 [Halobacillus mangrovi]
MNINFDKNVFLYLAAVVAGFFLINLSAESAVTGFFEDLFFYVGAIAMALFSFVIIFFSLFSFFKN